MKHYVTVKSECSFKCFIKFYPDEDPLVSKHFAVQITQNKVVLTVFTY